MLETIAVVNGHAITRNHLDVCHVHDTDDPESDIIYFAGTEADARAFALSPAASFSWKRP